MFILDLCIPPGEGFLGPCLIQFKDLEKSVCEVTRIEYTFLCWPLFLHGESEHCLSISVSKWVSINGLTWTAAYMICDSVTQVSLYFLVNPPLVMDFGIIMLATGPMNNTWKHWQRRHYIWDLLRNTYTKEEVSLHQASEYIVWITPCMILVHECWDVIGHHHVHITSSIHQCSNTMHCN